MIKIRVPKITLWKNSMKAENNNQKASEFTAPRWAVINAEECAAMSLSYEEAVRLKEKLSASMQGLCIVTNEAAHKIISNKKQKIENLQVVTAPNTFAETL
jgi:hypothetical protein